MAELLRTGGKLLVVGCARSEPRDALYELASAVANRMPAPARTYWEHSSPTVWPPAQTYREMSSLSATVLPGSHFRRRLYWRYSLAWRKPGG